MYIVDKKKKNSAINIEITIVVFWICNFDSLSKMKTFDSFKSLLVLNKSLYQGSNIISKKN